MKRARALALSALGLGLLVPLASKGEQPPATTPPAPISAQDSSPPAAAPNAPGSPSSSAPVPAPTPPTAVAPALSPPTPALSPARVAEPAPAPAPVPPPAAPRVVLSLGEAFVHVAVSHRDAWLETRSAIDGGEFERTCAAPCDIKLPVDGREARVVAPGMTTSNVFRFDAGAGVANVRVEGGSATARRVGIITLVAGIPVALAGMALFAQGRVKEQGGVEVAGIVGLAAGGLSVAISLPLLLKGTTDVKSAKGSLIALAPFSPAL